MHPFLGYFKLLVVNSDVLGVIARHVLAIDNKINMSKKFSMCWLGY